MAQDPQIKKALNAERGRRRKITLPGRSAGLVDLSKTVSVLKKEQIDYLTTPLDAQMPLLKAGKHFGISRGTFSRDMATIKERYATDMQCSRTLNLHRVFQVYHERKRLVVTLADANQIHHRNLEFSGNWEEVEKSNIFPATVNFGEKGRIELNVDQRTPRDSKLAVFLIPPVLPLAGQELQPDTREKTAPESVEDKSLVRNIPCRRRNGAPDLMNWIALEAQYSPYSKPDDLSSLCEQTALAKARKILDYAISRNYRSIKALASDLKETPNIPNYHSLRRLIIFGGFCEILLKQGYQVDQLPKSPNSIRPIGIRPKADLIKIQEKAAEMVALGAKLNDTTYGLAVESFDSGEQKAPEQLIEAGKVENLENLKAEILRKSLRLLDTDPDAFSSYFAELAKSGGSSFRKICNQTLELQEGKNGGI